VIEKTKPSDDWPDVGSVEFHDYSTRYREERDPVLKNISANIKGSEKVDTLHISMYYKTYKFYICVFLMCFNTMVN